MLFTRSSQTIKQVERGRSCGRVGVAKIRLFWPVWGLASEFYTRQVRVCVLPVSSVFCLLLFVEFQCLLFVFLRAVCSCVIGVCFGRCFGENFANFVEVLCWVCCLVDFRFKLVGFIETMHIHLGCSGWDSVGRVFESFGHLFWRKLCRVRGSAVLSLLGCGLSGSSGLFFIGNWKQHPLGTGVLWVAESLSVVFSNRSVTW